MNSQEFINFSKFLFVNVCKELNITEEEGRKYEKEFNEEFGCKFKFSFYEYFFSITNINSLVGAGLYIKNNSRGDFRDKKINFMGYYFKNLFFVVLENRKEEKEILTRIETIENSIPRTWTIKNTKAGIIDKDTVIDKLRKIEEIENDFIKKYPQGFKISANRNGEGYIVTPDNKVKIEALALSFVSKKDGIINWKWDIRKVGTPIDLETIKIKSLLNYLEPELKLDFKNYEYLCTVLALIFNLEYIDIYRFLDDSDVEEKLLLGIRFKPMLI